MRLPNGYGSVYKLTGKRRKPYIAMTSHGIDDNGRVIRTPLGYYETKKEALNALAMYNNDPSTFDPQTITFGEVLEKYIAFCNEHKPLSSTIMTGMNKFKPILNMRMIAVKTPVLQQLVDKATPAMGRLIKTCLVGFYKFAIAHEYATVHYGQLLTTKAVTKSTMHRPFTPEEIHTLWQNTDNEQVRVALILIYTGMRIQELLILKNSNVFDTHIITGIKTKAGIDRTIPLHHAIIPLMKSIQHEGEYFYPENQRNIRNRWKHHACPVIREHLPHDARHTCETMLDNLGINKRIIQLIVGHAGRDVDDNVYTHKTLDQLIEAINKLPVY
jgi:site-specific recombinase XerD